MSANLVNIYLICTLWKYFKRFYWSKDHEGYLRISTKLATKHPWLSEILKGACISSRVDSVVFLGFFVVVFLIATQSIWVKWISVAPDRVTIGLVSCTWFCPVECLDSSHVYVLDTCIKEPLHMQDWIWVYLITARWWYFFYSMW